MSLNTKYLIFIFFAVLQISAIQFSCFSQSRDELEKKKKKTQEEIEYTNKLLNENKKSKQQSTSKLELLKKQIKSRNELISNINNEIKLTNTDIEQKKQNIIQLQKDIEELKDEYAKMIYYAYKNKKSYDRLIYILSSKDFNQAYRRLKYLQQYSAYRKKQVKLITGKQNKLSDELSQLEVIKTEKQQLYTEQKSEKEKLSKSEKDQKALLTNLKKKEKDLKNELKKKEEASRKIQKAIEEIIAEEARKAAAIAKSSSTNKNSNTSKKSTTIGLTPEDQLISTSFGKNKGRFPWPTEKGIVVSTFGEHAHPVLPGIKIVNNGIDISTTQGSHVRAIFDGEVRSVITIQGANQAVIIRHGNYLTVYQNLREVTVKKGSKVKAKQVIGTVFTDVSEDNKSIIHFEIWNETKKLNPELWLSN